VATAEAALDRLYTNEYDLIILDVKLPGLSGIELHKILKETMPSLVRRVIFITGDVIGQDTLNFFSESKVPYLMKPFHIEDLDKAINEVASQHR
jgi:DNA-binding response OmpR family regulator